MAGLAHRVDSLDWEAIGRDLDAEGHALVPPLLGPEECRDLAALHDRPERFRARIDMSRHRFGAGEYQYFADPLPEPVAELRAAFYRHLAPVATHWAARLGGARSVSAFPADLPAYLARCHDAGQT